MGSSSTMRTRKPMGKLSVFELLSAIDEISALGDWWCALVEGESEGETECVDVAVVVIVVMASFFVYIRRFCYNLQS